jgi:hypothetical protein
MLREDVVAGQLSRTAGKAAATLGCIGHTRCLRMCTQVSRTISKTAVTP